MPEALLLAAGLAVAAAIVLVPLRAGAEAPPPPDDAAAVRHRAALEALRDVEADHRAGSLDEEAYERELGVAEAHAAATRAALDDAPPDVASRPDRDGRRLAVLVGAVIAVVLVAGSFVPALGIANGTVVDEARAAAETAETARRDRIRELTEALAADATDTATISELADAYLAGSSAQDLAAAIGALQLLLAYEPDRADAYERVVGAYIRAGDWKNARAALDSYAATASADPVEVAFLTGLVALRGEEDEATARAAFDEFLELAPDDPRAAMVRGLRDEAAGGGS